MKRFKRTPVYVVLDNIRSLYNVGSFFRTSDAILAAEMYLCGITGRPPRKEIDKVALGAVNVVPWVFCQSAVEAVLKLKENGVHVCAVELTDDATHFQEVNYSFPLALVFGNEVDGISDEVMEHVDSSVSIPMLGKANSLNVATAYGIMAYEVLKQYKNGDRAQV